jgi:hypothetical protein
MDLEKRNTKKYSFKSPDLTKLRKLGSLVSNPTDFRGRYGKLLSILKTNVEEGILDTLVQFYDPLYHCFTFPDYQLVPTLEEYSYWVGLPVSDKVPFSGLEEVPKPSAIAAALHLKTSDIVTNITSKGGFQGLTSKFLFGKAFIFAEAGSIDAFEAILALLIYGLVLFPNVDFFVDINAIQIFLIGNPVPTLLADAYHSIHHRTQKGNGTIICCAPLLYRWFISHLPHSNLFKENPDKLKWPQRLIPLAPADIVWYNAAYDIGMIIDSCGEFPNVPLLGTRGGISYNPILARRQFGYPMRDKPENILLAGVFYRNEEGNPDMRARFVRAWHTVHKKEKNQLGKKLCIVSEPYTQWVIARAAKLGMPYHLKKSPPSAATSSTPSSTPSIPFENKEEFHELLARMKLERDTWERKFHTSELENEELKKQLKEKDDMLFMQDGWIIEKDALLRRDARKRKRQDDLFSSAHPKSIGPPASKAWKEIVDKLVTEKAMVKSFYEDKIEKLNKKMQGGIGSSSHGTS